jgi:hypothetical protein
MLKLLPWFTGENRANPLVMSDCAAPGCSGRKPLLGLWWKDEGVTAQGRWYCSAECCREAVQRSVAAMLAASRRQPALNRMPLGLLLVSQGRLREEQVREALEAQRASGEGRIGSWLRRSGAITAEELTRALGQQSNCPVLALEKVAPLADRLPLHWCRRQRVLPVYWSQARNTLWLAFGSPVRYAALRAVEQILECRCDPCMVDEEALGRALENAGRLGDEPETVFRALPASEIAAITVSYAAQLQAREVRWVECGGDIWVRFLGRERRSDIFFEGPGEGGA